RARRNRDGEPVRGREVDREGRRAAADVVVDHLDEVTQLLAWKAPRAPLRPSVIVLDDDAWGVLRAAGAPAATTTVAASSSATGLACERGGDDRESECEHDSGQHSGLRSQLPDLHYRTSWAGLT